MQYFLSGTDRFHIFEYKDRIEQDFSRQFPRGERFVFDVEERWDEVTKELFLSAVQSDGLFATPHLVVLRGGEYLDDRGGEWIASVLKSSPDSVTAILVYCLPPRKKLPKWWQVLEQQGKVLSFVADTSGDTKKTLDTILEEFSVTIEPAAAQLLLDAFPQASGRLSQEVKRLALESDGVITLAHAVQSVTVTREQNVFAALESLARGDCAMATALFRKEETEPDAPFALLGLCAWQVRRLIAIKELSEQEHMTPQMIAKELKTSPYPIQKTLPLLRRLSMDRLKRALTLLADFDRSTKTGRMRPGVALDLFVWKF